MSRIDQAALTKEYADYIDRRIAESKTEYDRASWQMKRDLILPVLRLFIEASDKGDLSPGDFMHITASALASVVHNVAANYALNTNSPNVLSTVNGLLALQGEYLSRYLTKADKEELDSVIGTPSGARVIPGRGSTGHA